MKERPSYFLGSFGDLEPKWYFFQVWSSEDAWKKATLRWCFMGISRS